MKKPESRNRTLPLSPNLKTGDNKESTTIRIRFARKGATSFVAHLDMMRIFERSLKRAGIDCEYSQGFNPRPVMAFALPLGVGVETIDDYVDITVNGRISPVEAVTKLKRTMPQDIDIIGGTIAPESKESMMAQVVAAQYLFLSPFSIAEIEKAVDEAPSLMVTKIAKGEKKTFDAKPLILSMEIQDANSFKVLVKAGSKENLRPDLFLESLAGIGCFPREQALAIRMIRVGTFIRETDGRLVRPL